jgi:hypothetical protein
MFKIQGILHFLWQKKSTIGLLLLPFSYNMELMKHKIDMLLFPLKNTFVSIT